MANYCHPVFAREHESPRVGIFNTTGRQLDMSQGSTQGWDRITDDVEGFFQELRDSEKTRKALGIPDFTYHAYSFPCSGYNIGHVHDIIEWARGHDQEVRAWVNEQSALLLIVVADPDMSEDSGWKLYEHVKKNANSHESYGLSSWFEFCKFGVPIPDDWLLGERNKMLIATSPDGKQIAYLGG